MAQRELGYVVVEFNQASGQPEISSSFPYLHRDKEEAMFNMGIVYDENRAYGRRERFEVATLTIEEDD